MEIRWPLDPADPTTFHGAAFMRLIGAATEQEHIRIYYVSFEPGARTNWHAHSGEQILLVTSGRCRYQVEGEPIGEISAGESVRFVAGARHWHGASPNEGAEHVAINIDARETSWLARVTDLEYAART